ncbi:AMP-binding protein [Stakelama tenebrarum]|uniref:Propionyl-CoA synthetase n=1 Tax=Stakelama tenebrarum TaxID=2711215 RepID=A0A6G6Y6S0_9SPHN|nr:AMP-binding protein [Sphingosinithalassobacter tenebrarum]QIG80408.1 propionyl-CoA synthetase [Sphingosinithalassobacter tenebrarum]
MPNQYPATYDKSRSDREGFWLDAAETIEWDVAPSKAWDESRGWFGDGMLNSCYNAVDRHVAAGHGDRTAVIYDSPVTDTIRHISYAELQDQVARTAGMLAGEGVGKGDRVVIYMPMIPETLFAMLACARIGAIHSVVFGGFAAPELAKRIDDAQPKVLMTASCGVEGSKTIPYKPLVNAALDRCKHAVDRVILLQRPMVEAGLSAPRDRDWNEALAAAQPAECVPVSATDPLYILYTSGTTGTPKGVVRENGGHAVALAWSMANIYHIGEGDVFWAASDVGWVVGHSYIVYAPLLVGATTVLFEGKPVGTPDAGTFWRTIVRHGVKTFFTAPTAIRAIRKEDPEAKLLHLIGLGDLQAIFLAGERADPDTIHWAEEHSRLPVIDHWWQTELGWPAIASCFALGDTRRKAGSAGFPVPGYRFAVLDDAGKPLGPEQTGQIAIETPLPPGCYRTLWNNPERYRQSFAAFPGYYETGDAGHIDSEGFVHIMGRTDDIINVAGHRLSTGQMEEIVAARPEVAECAVIGVDDALKGMIPMAFAVVKAGAESGDALRDAIVGEVRSELGPVAALKQVHLVRALPKTRSGKILRATLRKLANGETVATPPTIEDPSVLDEYRALFAGSDADGAAA